MGRRKDIGLDSNLCLPWASSPNVVGATACATVPPNLTAFSPFSEGTSRSFMISAVATLPELRHTMPSWYTSKGLSMESMVEMILLTAFSSASMRVLSRSFRVLSSGDIPAIDSHCLAIAALSCCDSIQRYTADRFCVIPVQPPFVLASLLSVCSIAWSQAMEANSLASHCGKRDV